VTYKNKYDQHFQYINKKPLSPSFSLTNKSFKLSHVKKPYPPYKLKQHKTHNRLIYNLNPQQITFNYNAKYIQKLIIPKYNA
ncbi:hypothetical protein, partial [Staphylococcus pasteuri]|uniref:hypothetical protein n=1 Tax=Staphylococcus pasteuri TaxID=45972 RepID=UPI001C9A0EED